MAASVILVTPPLGRMAEMSRWVNSARGREPIYEALMTKKTRVKRSTLAYEAWEARYTPQPETVPAMEIGNRVCRRSGVTDGDA